MGPGPDQSCSVECIAGDQQAGHPDQQTYLGRLPERASQHLLEPIHPEVPARLAYVSYRRHSETYAQLAGPPAVQTRRGAPARDG